MAQLNERILSALDDLQGRIGQANRIQGFHEEGDALRTEVAGGAALRNYRITKLALIMTEAAEAIEELRIGRGVDETYYSHDSTRDDAPSLDPRGRPHKPEGVPSELADILIRVLDFAEEEGFLLSPIVAEKLAYNATRPYRHGKKV